MDLSLDDIIQKRNIRVPFKGRGGNNRGRPQGRGNAPNRTGFANQNMKFPKNRNPGEGVNKGRVNTGRPNNGRVNTARGRVTTGRVNTGRVNTNRVNTGRVNTNRVNTNRVNTGRVAKVNQTRPITDARQKIIQKNRQKLTDAREKLGELAKQTDARLKLEKLRGSRQGGRYPLHTGNARQPGFRNTDTIPQRNLQVPLQRTIRQAVGTVVAPNNWYRSSAVDDMDVDMELDTPLTGVSQVLRRTIPNEQATSRQLHRSSTYSSWPSSQHRPQKEIKSVSRAYIDDYPEERMRVKPQTNVSLSNMWSTRGANSAPAQNTMSMKPRSPGYRIIISNLHSSVIDEDIQELFEDVGPLLESRLVRPGTAEVVFSELKDAERAVEIYHNRQLDGQPMKCMLVNPRPVGSSPSHGGSRAMSSSLARSGMKVGSTSKSAIVPDISTIHKALFNRS